MEEAKVLSVQLVAWNRLARLPLALGSLRQQDWREFQVVVVDNASTDGVSQWLRVQAPGVISLRNFHRLPLARAHNQAFSFHLNRWPEASWPERFILIMDPEVVLAPDAIERLLAAFRDDPQLMMAGPKLLAAHGQANDGKDADRDLENIVFSSMIVSCGQRINRRRQLLDDWAGRPDGSELHATRPVFALSGLCVMVRASCLAQLKIDQEWLDEDISEAEIWVDLQWRCHWLGYTIKVVPAAVAWHFEPAHSRRRPKKHRPLRQPLGWSVYKNDAFLLLVRHLPWLTWRWFMTIILVICQPPRWAQRLQRLALWPRIWHKRRIVRGRRRCPLSAILPWFVAPPATVVSCVKTLSVDSSSSS